ncbi:MAG TPA: nucleotidyltransferase family protein, partial [Blastocatellia bacterium]|nr:nucleotidyltransferase family protein [Blastocatellia bacterium]
MSRAYNRGPGTVGAVSHSDMVSDISPSILERSRTAEPQARAGSAKGALLRSPKHAARPEAELICACARTVMDPSTSERIKSLVERDLDWEFVIEKAFLHSVLPLLYWNLHITCPKSVPEEVMKRLQLYFREHSCRNLLLASSLLRIIKALETEGIPTIPFKGPI